MKLIFNFILIFFEFLIIKKYSFNKITKKDKIILIYRIDLIGDYIASKDFLRLIRNSSKFKNHKIIFLGNKNLISFIKDFDKTYIDCFISFDYNLMLKYLYKRALINKINKYKFDYVINFSPIRNSYSENIIKNIKSGIKCGIVGIPYNLSNKYFIESQTFYDKIFNFNSLCYDETSLMLLNNITGTDNGEYVHHYNLNPRKIKFYQKKYNKTPYAIIFPSASNNSKRLSFDKYMQMIKYLYEKYGIISYLCGSKDDNKIFKNYDIKKTYIKNYCGCFKLSELPYLFKFARIILSNDTCAMWIAKCMQTPTLVFSNVFMPNKKFLSIDNNKKNAYYYKPSCINFVFPQQAYEQMLKTGVGDCHLPINTINMDTTFYNIDYILNNG